MQLLAEDEQKFEANISKAHEKVSEFTKSMEDAIGKTPKYSDLKGS